MNKVVSFHVKGFSITEDWSESPILPAVGDTLQVMATRYHQDRPVSVEFRVYRRELSIHNGELFVDLYVHET